MKQIRNTTVKLVTAMQGVGMSDTKDYLTNKFKKSVGGTISPESVSGPKYFITGLSSFKQMSSTPPVSGKFHACKFPTCARNRSQCEHTILHQDLCREYHNIDAQPHSRPQNMSPHQKQANQVRRFYESIIVPVCMQCG